MLAWSEAHKVHVNLVDEYMFIWNMVMFLSQEIESRLEFPCISTLG